MFTNYDGIMKTFENTVAKLKKRSEVLTEKNSVLSEQIDKLLQKRSDHTVEQEKCLRAAEKISDLMS